MSHFNCELAHQGVCHGAGKVSGLRSRPGIYREPQTKEAPFGLKSPGDDWR